MADLVLLRQEILNDPLRRDYSRMTDEELLTSLTTPDIPVVVPISTLKFLQYLGRDGLYSRLSKIATDTSAPDQLRAIVQIALKVLDSADANASIDFNDPQHVQMMEALTAVGYITREDRDNLYALGTKMMSRLDSLDLGEVHLGDVIEAREIT